MLFKIKSRFDGRILFSLECASLKLCVEAAVRSDARLDGASLDRANLVGARLDRANLVGASLVGARLDRASLVGASLDGASLDRARLDRASLVGASLDCARLDDARLDRANLVGASLVGARLDRASLVGASLIGARLDRASLDGASLDGASLDRASLVGARLDRANLDCASLVGIKPWKTVPFIAHIDALILAEIDRDPKALDMGSWHHCGTTHCRGGWAINKAGELGAMLEELCGPDTAAALIYAKSRPKKSVPNFYASNEDTLADIKACAEADPLPVGAT